MSSGTRPRRTAGVAADRQLDVGERVGLAQRGRDRRHHLGRQASAGTGCPSCSADSTARATRSSRAAAADPVAAGVERGRPPATAGTAPAIALGAYSPTVPTCSRAASSSTMATASSSAIPQAGQLARAAGRGPNSRSRSSTSSRSRSPRLSVAVGPSSRRSGRAAAGASPLEPRAARSPRPRRRGARPAPAYASTVARQTAGSLKVGSVGSATS